MRLYEYEGKRILQNFGVEVPKGILVKSPQEARAAADQINGPVVLKTQILATGRGKAGGIRFAATSLQAEKEAQDLLGSKIKEYTVDLLLVEEKLDTQKELYVAATYQESTKGRVFLVSQSGGMEVNKEIEISSDALQKTSLSPWIGLQPYQARSLAFSLGFEGTLNQSAQLLFLKIWEVFETLDAILVEINPLVLTQDGRLIAADAHIEIDNDALYRQRERLAALQIFDRDDNARPPTTFEIQALAIDKADYRGVAGRVVEFPGNLGLLIGAGGGSLTLFDAVLRNGGNPANYCEVGGNPPVSKIYRLCKLILQKPAVKGLAVMTNVFSNSRVDFLARGVIKAMLELGIDPSTYPLVFRSAGAFEEDGYAILRMHGVRYFGRDVTLEEAARAAVSMIESRE